MLKNILSVSVVLVFLSGIVYGDKSVVVDLSTQVATAYENDIPIFSGNISSGTAKRATPVGYFHVLEKDIDHVSNSWPKPHGGAKMHYMLRLTRYGIAMHLGYVPNYPASHGCIRLQNGFAQRMYRWAYVGMPVRVVGHAPKRVYRTPQKRKNTKRYVKAKKPKVKRPVMVKREVLPVVRKHAKVLPTLDVATSKRVKTLDMVSSSPKAAMRVQAVDKIRWKNRSKRKVLCADPLKEMRG